MRSLFKFSIEEALRVPGSHALAGSLTLIPLLLARRSMDHRARSSISKSAAERREKPTAFPTTHLSTEGFQEAFASRSAALTFPQLGIEEWR